MNVRIRKIHPDAVVPKYATALASGFDMVAVEDVIIAPGETKLVRTGLAFEIPGGYEMQVRPRSGISLKTKLRISNSPGTIDRDFTGEVGVIVDNINEEVTGLCDGTIERIDGVSLVHNEAYRGYYEGTYIIRKGDRIAQGVIAPVVRVTFEVVDELTETERGAGGFGSTGVTE